MSIIQRYFGKRFIISTAKLFSKKVQRIAAWPLQAQDHTLQYLVSRAKDTRFGRNHYFHSIENYEDFKKCVPLRDYEGLKEYIDVIIEGGVDVLWPGRPIYFAYTSGTTACRKYIPVTKDSIASYRRSARNALLTYIDESGHTSCISGRAVFFTHNIELTRFNDVPVGPISGIAYDHAHQFVKKRTLPSEATGRIKDFEKKIDMSVEETIGKNVTLINGIPPWVQLYFNKLIEQTGKPIKDIFPNFSLLAHFGANIEPYRAKLERSIGKKVDTVNGYAASEGFIAFQDSQVEPGLLLNLQGGIFYEFVPASEAFADNPTRVSLRDVELGVDYVVILNTNAGLWGYNLGDKVRFVSKNPYRLVITGRTKHFLSTAGEHLITEEVESALTEASNENGACVSEFTVAPQIDLRSGLPYHEWFIEFENPPSKLDQFAQELNTWVCNKNINYKEFCEEARIILPLQIRAVPKGGFARFMKSAGKLGGQNKVPHLLNDRSVANALERSTHTD